ncbi:MAG: formyltetrahydrofolate deformylase [Burkholderiales bacterium]|nr:formyltetrahydrofolate deformylase [Burkholderiales bacterium]
MNTSQDTRREFVLALSCRDSKGVVHAVSGLLYQAGCSIIDSQQFGDVGQEDSTGYFFMRVHFDAPDAIADIHMLERMFTHAKESFHMSLAFHDLRHKTRVLLLVSAQGHCLNDLLFRQSNGQLPIEIVGVASNHAHFEGLARNYGLPFHHFPIAPGSGPEGKQAQEQQIEGLMERERADLLVLARYMQILSAGFCERLAGRAINIHHSFLPSFKGARPYAQAHARGVKLIGATAHYVTADLDEGPIIEQDVARVDHSDSHDMLAMVGTDVESAVLARAVKWHCEHRVLLNGHKTVVFR